MYEYVHVSADACGGQKGALCPLELELWAVDSRCIWVLGVELGSSAKPPSIFSHWANSPTPKYFNLYETEALVICGLLHESKIYFITK